MERTCHNCEHFVDENESGSKVVCEILEIAPDGSRNVPHWAGLKCEHWREERPSTVEVIADARDDDRRIATMGLCFASTLGIVREAIEESCECDCPGEDRDGSPTCPACAVWMRFKMKLAERGFKVP